MTKNVTFLPIASCRKELNVFGKLDSPDSIAAVQLLFCKYSWAILIPATADFDLARNFVGDFATQLRGPDALHLAIASNNSMEEILTLDDGLIYAARKLELKARRGIRSSV